MVTKCTTNHNEHKEIAEGPVVKLDQIRRRIEVNDDTLGIEIWIATSQLPFSQCKIEAFPVDIFQPGPRNILLVGSNPEEWEI